MIKRFLYVLLTIFCAIALLIVFPLGICIIMLYTLIRYIITGEDYVTDIYLFGRMNKMIDFFMNIPSKIIKL